MGDFTFNGITASSLGVVVEHRPHFYAPAKRLTTTTVAGRSGKLTYWDGSYENYPQPYACWFKGEPLYRTAIYVKEWLLSAPVSSRLEDTYSPAVFRLATFAGPMDIENKLDRHGRCVITFDCAPQSFLISGETAIECTGTAYALNPSHHETRPLIAVTGTLNGIIDIGAYSIDVNFFTPEERTLWIDCETRESYEIINGVYVFANDSITTEDFPKLIAGLNRIAISGGITSARVIPRWYFV